MNRKEAMRLIECISEISSVINNLSGFKSIKLLAIKGKLTIAAVPLQKEIFKNNNITVEKVLRRIKDKYPGYICFINGIVLSNNWSVTSKQSIYSLICDVMFEYKNEDNCSDTEFLIDCIANEVCRYIQINETQNKVLH